MEPSKDLPGDFSRLFGGRLGLLAAVWDLLVVAIGLGTSYLVYILPTTNLGTKGRPSKDDYFSSLFDDLRNLSL